MEYSRGSKISVVANGKLPETPVETIDKYLKELKENQQRWAQDYPISKRIKLLEETLKNVDKYKDEWVKEDLAARHIPEGHWDEGSSFIGGPAVVGRIINAYIRIMKQIEIHGGNKPFSKARQDGDIVIVSSYPLNVKDSLLFGGFRGEIHLEKGAEDLVSLQAKNYKDKSYKGGVSLVLGAGNVSFLTVNDIMSKLFVDKEVVILKANPNLEYLGPLLEKILEPFIKEGFLRIANGGAKEGKILASHPLVDDIHITGSDKSFEAIVYGGGEEGAKNKAEDHRLNPRPITGELGSVTPVIVVPGNWKESDFEYQANNIFSMLAPFAGYTCCAVRVLILPRFWKGSQKLIEMIEERMEETKLPINYYPGTNETVKEAMSCYPDASKFGELDDNNQPWMLAKNLNAESQEAAFEHEFWAAFMSQAYVEGDNREEYLHNAVKFANEKLWGTLAATIIIDPKTEKDMTASGSLTKAIDDLKYGTVTLNVYPAIAIAMGSNPWGGYPGSTYTNIQSGNGFVSNPFMLDKIEKSVVYAPFIIKPTPIWFVKNNPKIRTAKAFTNFAISNKLTDFAKLLIAAIRG